MATTGGEGRRLDPVPPGPPPLVVFPEEITPPLEGGFVLARVTLDEEMAVFDWESTEGR